MGAKGEMIRRLPYALSCFGGSSVSDEMKSRRRSARSLSWSRSRAKKKTVPLDYEEDNDNAQEMKDIPSAKVTATKKGLFQRFHKDKSYKSPACHVTSKCDTQTQTVTLFQEPVLPAQMKIKIDQTGSPTKPAGTSPTVSDVQNKKKKRGGEIDVGVALIALVVTLVTMLLGGRCLTIAFTSIGFYTLPYFISATAMSSQRNRTYSVEMYPSLEQYSVKILIQDLASMSGKINRSILFGR